MSIIIINNKPGIFNCHYSKEYLPSCDYSKLDKLNERGEVVSSKPRDINFLMSQIVGALLRGDKNQSGESYVQFYEQTQISGTKKDSHEYRVGQLQQKRLNLMLENAQELGGKYIMLWMEQKMNRS